MGFKHGSVEERFARHVVKTDGGCWLWTAAKNRRGYGRLNVAGKARLAHRISFEMANGPVPDGRSVCHTCDNPACVNPEHLFAATHYENMQDMTRKGRASDTKGEKCGKAILTTPEVLHIREELQRGRTGTWLAERFGVSYSAIYGIKHRKRWAHLDTPAERAFV